MKISKAAPSASQVEGAPRLEVATIGERIVSDVTRMLWARTTGDREQYRPQADEPGLLDSSVGIGVDLVDVSEVQRSIEELGDRYLRRIYTEDELGDCHGPAGLRADSVAARFAAKEAALKALRPVGARPPWLDIELRRRPDGSCEMRWHGSAEQLVRTRRVESTSVSLSHEAGIAVAVVVVVFGVELQGG